MTPKLNFFECHFDRHEFDSYFVKKPVYKSNFKIFKICDIKKKIIIIFVTAKSL